MTIRFSISDWAVWSPGLDKFHSWQMWADAGIKMAVSDDIPDVSAIPMMLRRRLSRLGRRALGPACQVAGEKLPRLVFSSRHGDSSQTLELLKNLGRGEALSPMGFSMSVHNSIAGMMSIATGNYLGHTAVSGDGDSFTAGLLEGLCQLNDNSESPVLLVCYDEPVPSYYAPFDDPEELPLTFVLLLDRPGDGADTHVFSRSEKAALMPTDSKRAGLPGWRFIKYLLNNEVRWDHSAPDGAWQCTRGI